MGCSLGKEKHRRRSTFFGRRNTLVVRPPVKIEVGEGIVHKKISGSKIIFIFGGPGSGKGTIVNNLISMFDFRFVCGEDLLLFNLNKNLLDADELASENIYKLQNILQEDSSHLTLTWLLELIEKEILKHGKNDIILVDVVPNLKFLLKVPTFSKSCNEEMEAFEQKFPVAFAIDLALDQDHLISNINQTHACTNTAAKKDDKGNSDEMDTSRTQRRFNIYLNSVSEFLKYFETSKRLLTVDTSCGNIDAVWGHVSEYVVGSELSLPKRGLEQVLLFKLEHHDYEDVDRDRYPLTDIDMSDLVRDYTDAQPLTILKQLRIKLKEYLEAKAFLVNVQGSALCRLDQFNTDFKSQLMFMECEVGQLDYFMHGLKRRTSRKKSIMRKRMQSYKAVTTLENEALIFPTDTDSELCQKICQYFIFAES